MVSTISSLRIHKPSTLERSYRSSPRCRPANVVTVPEVRVTPDLRHAVAYVMPLGGKEAEGVVAALDKHRKFLRGELAHKVTLKYMPDLKFEVDRSFEAADHIERLLRTPEVARDLDRHLDENDGDVD